VNDGGASSCATSPLRADGSGELDEAHGCGRGRRTSRGKAIAHSCSGELASASRFEYLQQRKNTDLGKNQLDSLSGEELNPWKKSEIHGSMSWIRELLHQAVLQVLHGGGSMSGCFGCPISHQFSMV